MDKLYFPTACWCDIIVLESEGHFAMIDTGTAGHFGQIRTLLQNLGATKLDFILITHFHRDHFGSCTQIIREFPTDKVYVKAYGNHESTDGDGNEVGDTERAAMWAEYVSFLDEIRAHSQLVMIYPEMDDITLGNMTFTVYNTDDLIGKLFSDPIDNEYRGKYMFNENTNSAMVYVRNAAGCSALLTGDCVDDPMTYAPADRLIERSARAIGHKVDIYKIPHHGCGDHTSEYTAATLCPDYAVITCVGCDENTLARLKAANDAIEFLYCAGPTHVFELEAPGAVRHTEMA